MLNSKLMNSVNLCLPTKMNPNLNNNKMCFIYSLFLSTHWFYSLYYFRINNSLDLGMNTSLEQPTFPAVHLGCEEDVLGMWRCVPSSNAVLNLIQVVSFNTFSPLSFFTVWMIFACLSPTIRDNGVLYSLLKLGHACLRQLFSAPLAPSCYKTCLHCNSYSQSGELAGVVLILLKIFI